jgi:predicted nucleic acid-binding protein
MTVLVVDASVAVKWLVNETDSPDAVGLLTDDLRLIAPRIVRADVAAALCKRVTSSALSESEAMNRIRSLESYLDEVVEDIDVMPRGVALATGISHHLFNCLYLALALRDGARLVTADLAFARKATAAGHGASVVLLEDFARP